MRILITGASSGIGLNCVKNFLLKGFEVVGIDLKDSTVKDENYTHYVLDISKDELPNVKDINILFNNAGLQNSQDDISNNLKGTIRVTEKYINPSINAILFNASASAISGSEFPEYAASKAGVVGYMKNVAIRLAKDGVIVNAISLGGVNTKSNDVVIKDEKLFKQIMDVTPLKKWMSEDEVFDWVYFLTCVNKSASGQNILIDNGEHDLNDKFVWPSKQNHFNN